MTPTLFEVSSAHEEGGERQYLVSTVEFLGNESGEVRAIRVAETEFVDGRRVPKSGTEREIPADLVLLAMGFTGPESHDLNSQLGLPFDGRGNVQRDGDYATSEPGVFVAGDAGRGQSLIVWAIAEGRAAAAAVDRFLEGETELPAPVRPTDRAIAL
jgi:glutamate synthase (NADPH/NADH) small chain